MAKATQERLPFLNIKRPLEDGTVIGYRIKKIGETREVAIEKGKFPGISTFCPVELLETTDKEYETGKKYMISTRHTMLKDKLREMTINTIADVVCVRKVKNWWQYAFENVDQTKPITLANLPW